ncbi:hypothetical protein SH661x_001315 [Planctomicrobium sp. SH661]|uniref:hypothetical protein n=1 Tax=Planctomicrobium sp. SH661 TaxID=3448124 RepID=UPI003F5BA7FE
MSWIAAKFSWITAVASLAMMLGVQTLHSPLQHALECCHSDSCSHKSVAQKTDTKKAARVSSCGHTHGKHVHGKHAHSHSHASDEMQHPGDAPQHSHDCQLCQFLTQSIQPLALPVLLTGEDVVTAPPVDILPEILLVSLGEPHVRGPPCLS